MRLILVGPSHIPRIRHALEIVRLPRPIDEIIYLGDGGYPIWKKSVFDECCTKYQKGDRILLIVADFRFGNSILTDVTINTESSIFFDGHTHVKRDLCSSENDEKMKKLCINALNAWKNRFGDDLTILHWTLALRTVKNRLLRQHIDNHGNYRHPIWNLDDPDIKSDIHGLADLQTASNLDICNSLTIDNDLHPSTLGYLYIIASAATTDHVTSLRTAKTVYMAGINTLVSKIGSASWPKTMIAGPSKILSSLQSALPKSAQATLSIAGLTIKSPGEITPQLVNDEQTEHLIYISDRSIENVEALNAAIADIHIKFSATTKAKISILFWDAIATQVMQWRARTQRNAPTGSKEKNLAANSFHVFWPELEEFDFKLTDRLIEYGAGGAPTFWGLISVISRVANLASHNIPLTVMNHLNESVKNSAYHLKAQESLQKFETIIKNNE